jgi:hypothetical protein
MLQARFFRSARQTLPPHTVHQLLVLGHVELLMKDHRRVGKLAGLCRKHVSIKTLDVGYQAALLGFENCVQFSLEDRANDDTKRPFWLAREFRFAYILEKEMKERNIGSAQH